MTIKDLAQNQEDVARKKKIQEDLEKEERNKKNVPLFALILINLIFLSLDARAVHAVYLLTNSYLLTVPIVTTAGGLVLAWLDIFYPHSRKHKNKRQMTISLWGMGLAIAMSGVLAFSDYVVGTGNSFSTLWSNLLWGGVILTTIAQGLFITRWWFLDKHIEAEAKIQEAHAEKSDSKDLMDILNTKLESMEGYLVTLETYRTKFGKDNVDAVAKLLDIPLPDEHKNPNSQAGRNQG